MKRKRVNPHCSLQETNSHNKHKQHNSRNILRLELSLCNPLLSILHGVVSPLSNASWKDWNERDWNPLGPTRPKFFFICSSFAFFSLFLKVAHDSLVNPEGMYSYSWVDCLLESWVEGVDWKAVAVDATKARVKAAEVFMVAVVGPLLEFVSICRKEKTEVVGGRVLPTTS